MWQYSVDLSNPFTFGTALQSGWPDGLPHGICEEGRDCRVTPEPATPVLVLTGIAVIGALIREIRGRQSEGS